MKKVILIMFIVLATKFSYGNDKKLSISMRLDQYMIMSENAIKNEDYIKSMEYLEKINDLKIEKLSVDFYYLYGKTSFELENYSDAKKNLLLYLNKVGKNGKYYKDSLKLHALSEEYLEIETTKIDKMIKKNFILVNSGSYEMGSNKNEFDEKPVHNVTVNSFFIGKYPILSKEYIEFLNNDKIDSNGNFNGKKLISLKDNDCPIKYQDSSFIFKGSKIAKEDNTPVVKISWWGAIAYCNWLSKKENLPVAYDIESGDLLDFNGNITNDISKVLGYRLPTEAEWEFAAKGGNNSKNTKFSGSNNLNEVGWASTSSNRLTGISSIGKKESNELGIYDMSGNVWEWCQDWYYDEAYNTHSNINPIYNVKTDLKVRRGGSWVNESDECRIQNRFKNNPSSFGRALGFRVVIKK
ncbi:MAG: formylglycine-generating enzyme family protein [Fusobacteria bacterium]|nr:formylglycine-generating enzyme family protein [Fusobacteriota bacterium]